MKSIRIGDGCKSEPETSRQTLDAGGVEFARIMAMPAPDLVKKGSDLWAASYSSRGKHALRRPSICNQNQPARIGVLSASAWVGSLRRS